MKPLFNRIHKVAGSIYKVLTPSEEMVRQRIERCEAMFSDYHYSNLK
jgi:hypothetical protein